MRTTEPPDGGRASSGRRDSAAAVRPARALLRPAWTEQDHAGAEHAQRDAERVPVVRPAAFDEPHPREGRQDVDAAIAGIRASGEVGIDARQRPRKQRQAPQAGQQPQRRPVKPQPGSERVAAGNLGDRGKQISRRAPHGRGPNWSASAQSSATPARSIVAATRRMTAPSMAATDRRMRPIRTLSPSTGARCTRRTASASVPSDALSAPGA